MIIDFTDILIVLGLYAALFASSLSASDWAELWGRGGR